jgi:phosphatidylinositol alpha-1,6-mannosyltransferase
MRSSRLRTAALSHRTCVNDAPHIACLFWVSMRTLALVTDSFGGQGGIAQYNRYFLSALAAARTSASIVILSRFGRVVADELPDNITHLRPVASQSAYAFGAISAAVKWRPVDLVFCGHLYMAPLAAAITSLSGARLWLQLHGIECWDRPGLLVQRAAEHAHLITAVSRFTKQRFLSWADVEPQRVRVLPNTVGREFTPGPKPRSLVERHGLKGRKVLLTVSRLATKERYKGHDRVIQSLPKVLAHHPEVTYVIVGEGDDRARLETLTETMGVRASVRFVGEIAKRELPDYYRLADLFVMPSTGEGFGIVFLEASAVGLPVIGGNCDGSVDALAEGRIGTLVDPDNVTGLAEAIVAILDRKQRRPNNVVETRRFAMDNFVRHVDDLVPSLC